MLRRARLLLLLVAALLVEPRAAFARPQLFCRMLDRVVTTCCCAAKRAAHGRECELRASPPDCCERIAPLGNSPAHGGFRHAAGVAPAALAVLLAGPLEPSARPFLDSASVHPARGPPAPPRTPLFISHCALLL
jgi:hypothetical protein